MTRVRAVFLGTPKFAAVSLQSLLHDDHFQIVGVVSQPDRPAGRNLRLTPSPVKLLAEKNGIPVITPEKASAEVTLSMIRTWAADIAIVVAFGQILSQQFLDSFIYGAVNLHASLLPRWRGAAPIQRAIEAGDKTTGVCLQKMVRALDAGDVFGQRFIEIDETMTALQLHDRLADLGTELLHIELMDFIRGHLLPQAQNESLVTYAHKIKKEECKIDWSLPATTIHNKVRAYLLGPGAYCQFNDLRIKILSTQINGEFRSLDGAPGEVLAVGERGLEVKCGEGSLTITELQFAGKERWNATRLSHSNLINKGDILK